LNRHAKIVLVLIVVSTVLLFGGRYLKPLYDDWRQQGTSDARGTRGTIRIGVDNWVGYFPLCSDANVRRMRRSGYLLKCEDDGADYAGRMAKLRSGDLDMAVATVDSYLLAGHAEQYPATIIAVLDESKGGDALVARADRIDSIDDLKAGGNFLIALTPDSPSEHLLKSIGVHFDIPLLRQQQAAWRVDTDGSEAALALLKQEKVDAAVLWEPDVSRALEEPGIKKLLSTDDTEGLIVDILLVNRRWAASDPEAIYAVLSNYFKTLKEFRDNPKTLHDAIAENYSLPSDQVNALLDGVEWTTLSSNARSWYGIARQGGWYQEGLIDTIESASDILIESGDFDRSPIPNGDPYRLTNSQFVADLFSGGLESGSEEVEAGEDSLARSFEPLSEDEWQRLTEVGTLKIRPIVFQSGSAGLTYEGKQEIDRAVENLRHYPNFRLVVSGHTGLRGNAEANQKLSQSRAESVTRYLRVTYALDINRVLSSGRGADSPLPRQPGESDRSYNYRLPRVELTLVAEEF
jgi:outer membrane protein OmpA-like peptidoglycan-associated protein/ABC-type amino acid transport substrate-binding protein